MVSRNNIPVISCHMNSLLDKSIISCHEHWNCMYSTSVATSALHHISNSREKYTIILQKYIS